MPTLWPEPSCGILFSRSSRLARLAFEPAAHRSFPLLSIPLVSGAFFPKPTDGAPSAADANAAAAAAQQQQLATTRHAAEEEPPPPPPPPPQQQALSEADYHRAQQAAMHAQAQAKKAKGPRAWLASHLPSAAPLPPPQGRGGYAAVQKGGAGELM